MRFDDTFPLMGARQNSSRLPTPTSRRRLAVVHQRPAHQPIWGRLSHASFSARL